MQYRYDTPEQWPDWVAVIRHSLPELSNAIADEVLRLLDAESVVNKRWSAFASDNQWAYAHWV